MTALRPRAPLPSASASSCRRIRSRIGCNTRLYGLKVTIRIVGRKGTEKWIEDGCEVYSTRLKPANIELNTEWHKSNEALVKGVQSDWSKNIKVVLLDPKGQKLTSESFTLDFYRLLEQGGSRLVYAIGGVSNSCCPCSRLSTNFACCKQILPFFTTPYYSQEACSCIITIL